MSVNRFVTAIVLAFVAAGCASTRRDPDGPTYTEVRDIFNAQCVRCHAGPAPAAGWRADSYVGAISCTADGRPTATSAPDDALRGALERPDHAGFLREGDRDRLLAWLAAGAPNVRGGAHPTGFANPRSASSHAAALRAGRYAALVQADNPDACARCHDGLPGRPADVLFGAPGATACTDCHAEPGFPFACATCHGPAGASSQNPCFHPSAKEDRAHLTHAGASASRSEGLPCSACHPVPPDGRPSAIHANGWTEVWFDYAIAGRSSRFDAKGRVCTGTCHARGGARPDIAWTDPPVGCNDCHRTPPVPHFPPPCSSCHAEANATGTALASPKLHVNGVVEARVAPTSLAHPAHVSPENAAPVPCETCHELPIAPGPVTVRLGGLATRGGRRASFDPGTKTCAGTYCHEGSGGTMKAPTWTSGPAARACDACHASPPPPPHPPSTDCTSARCHVGIVDGGGISAAGRAVHVNGIVDQRAP